MKLYLIASRNSERYERAVLAIEELGRKLGLDYEIVEAEFPSAVPTDFSIDLFQQRYGRPPRLGEVGCLLSHRKAHHLLVNSNEGSAIVLEDDFWFRGDAQYLRMIESVLQSRATIALLGHSRTDPRFLVIQRLKQPLFSTIDVSGFVLGNNVRINYCGTVAYFINREAALISIELQQYFVADDFSIYRNSGVRVLHPSKPDFYEIHGYSSSTKNHIIVLHNLFTRHFFNEIYQIAIGIVDRLRGRENC